jgi:hypothetical protein
MRYLQSRFGTPSHFKMPHSHILIFAAILFGAAAAATAQTISTWRNNSGNWSNAADWIGAVPNEFPSTDGSNAKEADFTGTTASTVIVDSPVIVDKIVDTNPNLRILVNSAAGATLNIDDFDDPYKLAGSLIYDSSTTTAPLEIFNDGAATVSASGSNLISNIAFVNFPENATAPLTINNINIFTNDGLIEPAPGANGTINVHVNSFVNHGTIALDGGILNTSVPIDNSDGTLDESIGGGTINGAVSFSSASHFAISADGLGEPIIINSTTPTTLAGTLDVLPNGVDEFGGFTSSTVITLLSNSNGINGAFSNAPDGSEVIFGNNAAEFQINYTPDAVTLSNFVQLPEPGTAMCLITLTAISLTRRQRKN